MLDWMFVFVDTVTNTLVNVTIPDERFSYEEAYAKAVMDCAYVESDNADWFKLLDYKLTVPKLIPFGKVDYPRYYNPLPETFVHILSFLGYNVYVERWGVLETRSPGQTYLSILIEKDGEYWIDGLIAQTDWGEGEMSWRTDINWHKYQARQFILTLEHDPNQLTLALEGVQWTR